MLNVPANFSASSLPALNDCQSFDEIVSATLLGLNAAKLAFPPNCLS